MSFLGDTWLCGRKKTQKCAPKFYILNLVNSTEILAPKLLGDQSESEKSNKRKKETDDIGLRNCNFASKMVKIATPPTNPGQD